MINQMLLRGGASCVVQDAEPGAPRVNLNREVGSSFKASLTFVSEYINQ
jgi:hypothetical protein